MNNSKLLRITDDWSVYILENSDGSYLAPDGQIRYKNVGKSFDTRLTHEAFTNTTAGGILEVLDAVGKSKFHFPLMWLDTDQMRIQGLVRDEIIKIN